MGERASGDSGEKGAMVVEDDDGGAREALDRGPEGPSQVGGKRRVVISQRDYESKRQNFRFALIGRVNFHLISLDALRREAREKWNLSQGVLMHPLGKGYVIFQFQCEGDKAAMWQRSPLRVGDQVIQFQHWKPDFNIHEKQFFTKLVWIRFPDLSLEYWHENVLLSIAKAVGRPVALDRRTRQGLLSYFARVLVEIDISDLAVRVEEVQVKRFEPGTSQVLKKVDDEKQCAAKKLAEVPGAVYVEEDRVDSTTANSVGRLSPILEGNQQERSQQSPHNGKDENGITLSVNNSPQFPNMEEGEIQIDLDSTVSNLPNLVKNGLAQEDVDMNNYVSQHDVDRSSSETGSEYGSLSNQDDEEEGELNQNGNPPISNKIQKQNQEDLTHALPMDPVCLSSRPKRTGRREAATLDVTVVDDAVAALEKGTEVGEKRRRKKKQSGQASNPDKGALFWNIRGV
ncbi:uncharacterized protein LOC122064704 [Macadamia integrifolia]|uniref:uncharacterized protein LOC122064704 n=1 Tax=Macadamia integrifolia TaxID=60698 RepID=UPI001C4FBD13|nr:uncharacterized protein LOC122064704 [Macadamia integrifolia]